jgi:hypothetical protein
MHGLRRDHDPPRYHNLRRAHGACAWHGGLVLRASHARGRHNVTSAILSHASPASGWTADVLAGLGNEQPTAATVAFLEAWARAENTQAAFNPLATTQGAEGDTCFNYINGACGVATTRATNGRAGHSRDAHERLLPAHACGVAGNAPVVDDQRDGGLGDGRRSGAGAAGRNTRCVIFHPR